ncbi:MAG: hypothetical protein JWO93_3298 [Micrococcaceae bacterium]|nr:hypothetical protein [Micrococcaceae bacterium]
MLVLAAVFALAFVAWLGLGRGPATVDSKDVGFTVTDSTQTVVDFQVTKDPGAVAQCAVKALSESYAIVGWDVVTIGANDAGAGSGQGRTTAHRVALRTESLAVSGLVDSCWLVPAP